jgi:Domain of unknown function (DUF4440)
VHRMTTLLVLILLIAPLARPQDPDEAPPNPEMQRQEIVNIESETARAILLNNGTFFRRVYSDDFVGTLSHGQAVDKAQMVQAVQSADVKYDSFVATDIKVRIYQDIAVATCLWSSRGTYHGQHFSSQMRVTHVYVNGRRGWQVVAGQTTALPPDAHQPL